MPSSLNPSSLVPTRFRAVLVLGCAAALVASCGRGKVEDAAVQRAKNEWTADAPPFDGGTNLSPREGVAAPANRGDDALASEANAGNQVDTESDWSEVTPTAPAELSAIVRELDALARRDKRAAGRRAALAIRGLEVADADWEMAAEGDGSLYLGAEHVPMLRAIADHVFAADATYGEGLLASIPEELRASIVSEKVNAEVSEGKTEEIGEWILGLEDRDLATVARWELVRILFERDGMPDALANYPTVLKERSTDVMEAGQWFSVLEARNSFAQ